MNRRVLTILSLGALAFGLEWWWLMVLPAEARAADSSAITTPGSWGIQQRVVTPLESGAQHVAITLNGPKPARLDLVVFNSSRTQLRVISQANRAGGKPLRQVLPSTALAICNGGYFSHAPSGMLPSGLEICSGQRVGSFSNQGSHTAALQVDSTGPKLIWESEWQDSATISQLVQCGPYLLDAGQPVLPNSQPEHRYLRTFLATDEKESWCMGVTDSLAFMELTAILRLEGLLGFKPQRVMALDGGPSTGLAWRLPSGEMKHAQQPALVRNYIVLEKR
jgi:hypothetical protein